MSNSVLLNNYELCSGMFAKERMGFMPALCVAFLEELSDKEKLSFEELARQEERAEMVLKHPFLADKFARLVVAEGKDVQKSVAAREEGNQRFQEGNFQVQCCENCGLI